MIVGKFSDDLVELISVKCMVDSLVVSSGESADVIVTWLGCIPDLNLPAITQVPIAGESQQIIMCELDAHQVLDLLDKAIVHGLDNCTVKHKHCNIHYINDYDHALAACMESQFSSYLVNRHDIEKLLKIHDKPIPETWTEKKTKRPTSERDQRLPKAAEIIAAKLQIRKGVNVVITISEVAFELLRTDEFKNISTGRIRTILRKTW